MNPTVGEQLRQAREQKGLDVRDVVKQINIRLQYLQELENDHPELLPSEIHARGFLRLYAGFLGLDPEPLLESWRAQDAQLIQSQELQIPEQPSEIEKPKTNILEGAKSFLAHKFAKQPKEPPPPAISEKPIEEDAEPKIVSDEQIQAELPQPTEELKDIPVTQGEKQEQTELDQDKEAQPVLPKRSSQELFDEIGIAMKSRREKLGLTIADAEMLTKIKNIYIQAIEEGRFQDMPSTVQGRGMLFNYAKFLEMDDSAVMSLYTDALHTRRVERTVEKHEQKQPPVTLKINIPEKIRQFLTPDLVLGGGLVLALFVFIFWGALQVFSSAPSEEIPEAGISNEEIQITATISPVAQESDLSETPEPQMTQIAGVQINTPIPSPVATVNTAPLQLYIIAQQRAWMRITADGNLVFEGRTVPNTSYTYSANQRIDLMTGNGAALEVYFNQEYLGKLGGVGEVLNLSFTLDGLLIATPTATPIASPTQTAIPTQEELPESVVEP